MLNRRTGYPINPYTGFERGSYYDWDRSRDPGSGRPVNVGLFPVGYPPYRPDPNAGAYPGLR